MDDLTIYIPTRGRINNQQTWGWLPEEVKDRTFLVAEDLEADLLEMKGYPVLAHDVDGISATRQWIVDQHDVESRGRFILFLDDDLRIDYRRSDDPTKFLAPKKGSEAVLHMIREYRRMLDHASIAGIAARGGANRYTEAYRFNQRTFMAWGGDVEVMRDEGIRFDRTRLMADFDVFLQFLTLGYRSALLNTFVVGDAESNNEGGCSIFRTNDTMSEAAIRLASLWPEFVKTVERPAWKNMAGDTRLDVRVSWAKAYKSGLQNHRRTEETWPLSGEEAWYRDDYDIL